MYLHWHVEIIALSSLFPIGERVFVTILLLFCYSRVTESILNNNISSIYVIKTKFYKGDAFVQGTGLGLVICRTIVERFHGKIEVASTLGKGSRFAIVLPQEMRE